jgi:hypothetical protein
MSSQPQHPAWGRAMTSQQRMILGSLASVAVIVGAVSPWRTLGILKASGTDLTSDATLILAAGVLALVLVVLDKAAGSIAVIGLSVAALSIYHVSDVTSPVIFGIHPSLGWGLVVDVLGGLGLLVHGLVDLRDLRAGRRAIAEASRTTPA